MRSAGENSFEFRQSPTAVIFSSEAPAALLPAALESIQKGQVAISAASTQTSERSSCGSRPDVAGAAPSARPASRIGGQYAWMAAGTDGWANARSAAHMDAA